MRRFPSAEEIAQLPPDGGEEYNRLVFETSPYLRQHASNPVDWYPWSGEAFAAARSDNKPIFLSVGYSTCHWCHVMEHESFEDSDVAGLMNRKFVAIKVDREERPDLDHQYMAVTQAMQGHGGWPNSLFLTPNAEPFFAFTYLPREQLLGVLSQISELWETQMAHVAGRALDISRIVGGSLQAIRGGGVLSGVVGKACDQLLRHADRQNGGFGTAPKFPHADDLVLLTRCGVDDAFVGLSLTKMRHGGIYDQLAGGLHRYSTDEKWLLPHFEKMLYDQASLLNAYSEAYAKHGTPLFKDTAIEVLDFVDRELSATDGSFYSAIDADSEGEEGKSYLWTERELEEILGDDAAHAKQRFGTTSAGNFLDERSRERTGANVLTWTVDFPESESERTLLSHSIRDRLLVARNFRVQPMTDDKVLTDWNGMMIAAMARTGLKLGQAQYTQRAAAAANALLNRFAQNGNLTHQVGKRTAFLDDYAFFILALIELNQADFNPTWLAKARQFADEMLSSFEDGNAGGFFMTRDPLPGTGARPKAATDSAHRSGYAAATLALIKLGRLLQETKYLDAARRALEAASGDIEVMATGHVGLLLAYQELHSGAEVAVVAAKKEDAADAVRELQDSYAPTVVFIPVYPGSAAPEFAASLPMLDDKNTYYLCRDFTCELPTTKVDEVKERLQTLLRPPK